ncbi:MAG TPA: hypothetical protein DCX53_13740 [Anaerolineae bacterium]|nr:hypothetical protein [Anaerolineae bacterium]
MKNLASNLFAMTLLNSLTTHTAVLNSQGDIIAVNNPWKKFAQDNDSISESAYLGTNYVTVCRNALESEHDETVEKALDGLLAVLQGKIENFELEYPCNSPTEERWFSVQMSSFSFENEIFVLTSHRNITARKMNEIGLIENYERYRLLFKNSVDAIVLSTPEGSILAANPATTLMFGRSEEEIVKLGRQGLMDITDPRLIAGLKKRERTGNFHGEITGLRSDGSKFPIELTSSIFKDHEGRKLASTIFRDITDRKNLETKLVESEVRFRNLAKGSPDVIYTLDLTKHRVTYFNRDTFLGYSRNELMSSNSIQENVHPDDLQKVSAQWRQALNSEEIEDIEYRISSKAGDLEWVDSRIAVLTRNPDGTPKEIMVLLRPITERKQIEEQVTFQASLLLNVNDVIIGTDNEFRITYWNLAAQKIFGWAAEEVMGRSVQDVLQTQFTNDNIESSIETIIKTGVWKGEVIQYTKGNKPVNIHANIIALRNQSGEFTGYVSANRDITDLKLFEQKFSDLLESAPDAMVIVDSDGRIIFVNNQAEQIFGYKQDDMMGQPIEFLIPDRYKDHHLDHRINYFGHPKRRLMGEKLELYAQRKNGSEFPVEISLSPLHEKNGSILVIASVRDITKRKKAESAIRASEEKWHTLFDILPVGVSVLGADNEIVEMNETLGKILGISTEGLLAGEHFQQAYLQSDGTPFTPDNLPSAKAIKEQKPLLNVEVGIIKKDGEKIWTNVSASPLNLPDLSAVVVTTDITSRKQAEDELTLAYASLQDQNVQLEKGYEREQLLARTDSLTGVFNYRHFVEMATYEFANATRYSHALSVLIFDIDNFKKINDSLGHPFGDEMLKMVATIASERIRESDILTRYGGEEFLILLPNTSSEEAYIVAEDIRNRISSARLDSQKGPVGVTISVGIAQLFPKEDSIDELVKRSDQALYKAKEAGRNKTIIYS